MQPPTAHTWRSPPRAQTRNWNIHKYNTHNSQTEQRENWEVVRCQSTTNMEAICNRKYSINIWNIDRVRYWRPTHAAAVAYGGTRRTYYRICYKLYIGCVEFCEAAEHIARFANATVALARDVACCCLRKCEFHGALGAQQRLKVTPFRINSYETCISLRAFAFHNSLSCALLCAWIVRCVHAKCTRRLCVSEYHHIACATKYKHPCIWCLPVCERNLCGIIETCYQRNTAYINNAHRWHFLCVWVCAKFESFALPRNRILKGFVFYLTHLIKP